ncbi:hypothetical protein OKW35_002369 [Paraburkholderia sp. MM5477-R1]
MRAGWRQPRPHLRSAEGGRDPEYNAIGSNEGTPEAALPHDVQHRESYEPSTEIRVRRRPKRVLN